MTKWIVITTAFFLSAQSIRFPAFAADKASISRSYQMNAWLKSNENVGLTLEIQVSKTSYSVDETVKGQVFIKNDRNYPLSVYPQGLLAQLTIIFDPSSPGGVAPQGQPLMFGRPNKDETSIVLAPNETFGRVFHAKHLPVGKFKVTGMYQPADATEYILIVESEIMHIKKL